MKIRNLLRYDSEKRAFLPGGLTLDNGVITGFEEADDASDFGGDLVIPGLVDVHTHGRGGYDFSSATAEQMRYMKQEYARHGVTTVAPTLGSAPLADMLEAVARIREVGFPAAHVEGRYLAPAKRGAQNEAYLAPLDADEPALFASRAGGIRLHFSAAYERDREELTGKPDGSFFASVKAVGATAGLAHTEASYAQATALVEKGLTSFTHLFNAMPPIHHRKGGAVVAGLVSDAYVEMICDGFHLAPETVALVSRAKRFERIVLITDSMEGTGCPDGIYSLAGSRVTIRDGHAYTDDGAIAGSTLELLDGVRNFARFCGASFADVLNAATVHPAAMLGLAGVGQLKPGFRADFVRLTNDLAIKEVYVGGERLV